jgi:hypothetical protein
MEQGSGQEVLAIINDHTVAALRKYMDQKGASQTAIARACGLSPTVINQFLHGTYKGDAKWVTKAVEDFLFVEEEREGAVTSPEFVRTVQSEDVLTVLTMSLKHAFMGLVQARAGLGKTTTLREFVKQKSAAVMVTASTWNCSRGAIATLLGRAVRVSSPYSNLTDAVERIKDRLGSSSLIIIDEAQHLPRETLDGLRNIHDEAEVGLVLCGTLAVSARMSDKRVGVNYEQIASRIGVRRTLSEKVSRDDVEEIIKRAAPGMNLSGEVLDYCWAKANGPGAYRTMMRYLQVACTKAKTRDSVSLKHFKAAEEVLMV